MGKSISHEEIGGGRVILSRPDYIDSTFVNLRKYDERSRKKQREEKEDILKGYKDFLDRLVDVDGCLIVRSHPFLNGKIKLKEHEDYNGVGGGGQFIVLEARVDESQLGYSFWEEVWTHMRAFERMESENGRIDDKTTYIAKAGKDLQAMLENQEDLIKERSLTPPTKEELKAQAQERLEKILQQEVYDKLEKEQTKHRQASDKAALMLPMPFKDGRFAVKISRDSTKVDKTIIKEAHMVGFNDPASIFTPMYIKTIGERAVFFMEYIENTLSLDEIINETTLEEKIDLLLDGIRVLGRLKNKGGVHRDIKPPNLLIVRDGTGKPRLKVADYGVLRIYREDKSIATDKTYSGTKGIVGTPMFFSPRHANDPANIDFVDDLYSLFATFYVWLTGNSPNPITPTGYIDVDDSQEAVNVARKPEDPEKMRPVNPFNAALDDVINNEIRLRKDPNRKWYKPWTWYKDPQYISTKHEIKNDLYELCLVMAKALLFYESERYQIPREVEEDLKAVKDHKKAPHARAMLEEKMDHLKPDGTYENVLRKTKPYELLNMVFSEFDPVYEKAIKNPFVQKKLRRDRQWAVGIGAAVAVATAAASTTATYWMIDNYDNIVKAWNVIKGLF